MQELPNFNCFSTGSLSIFMVFIEAGFGVVAATCLARRSLTCPAATGKVMHARQAEKSLPPLNSLQTAGINLYFIMVYAVSDHRYLPHPLSVLGPPSPPRLSSSSSLPC